MGKKGPSSAEESYRPELVNRLADWILCLSEVLPWYTGVVYEGHTLRRDDHHDWFLVVRGTKRKEPVVTFIQSTSPAACFAAFAGMVKASQVRWTFDRFRGGTHER